MRLGRAVEGALGVVGAAEQRHDRAVGLHHHDRGLARMHLLAGFAQGLQRRAARGVLDARSSVVCTIRSLVGSLPSTVARFIASSAAVSR